jgi:membrane protein required for colicin V production
MTLPDTVLDYLIVLVVLVSAAFAAWRGFLWETLSIIAWVAAGLASLYFGPAVISLLHAYVHQAWLASILAYAGMFLLVFVPLSFFSRRFSDSVKRSPIGLLDRLAGVGFGVVRGLVIVGLAYWAFTYVVPARKQPSWLTEARLLPVVQSTADILKAVVSDHPRDLFAARRGVVEQAPPADQNARNQPAGLSGHDPMAELIRKNEAANPVPETIREPVQHSSAAKTAKTYGAGDRQALDRLVQTGGSGNR